MSDPQSVKIDRSVKEGYVKVQVQHTFGQNEQLNAEMDVPLSEAKKAVEDLYENVVNVRELNFRKEVAKYQLEQDLMAYTADEREKIVRNEDTINKNVDKRIKANKKEGKYDGE